ncbi:MAG: hypothetical protein ISEC1_P0618 [Thiomicrorhabdus sp.]|nr:MAG: hypothetical protein ISEC1_P0618 [Thiomicrorhabdus sp.]
MSKLKMLDSTVTLNNPKKVPNDQMSYLKQWLIERVQG